MNLVCEKYKQKMTAAEARCRHPKEYCKFRSSCMIHFFAKERDDDRPVEPEKKDSVG